MDGLNLDVVELVYIVLILSNLILDLLDLPVDSQLHILESLVVGILELGLLVLSCHFHDFFSLIVSFHDLLF